MKSIMLQSIYPARVCIFTHGLIDDKLQAERVKGILEQHGIPCIVRHDERIWDFGSARNHAVAMAETDWVMHLDADDTLTPDALNEIRQIMVSDADVIQAGYELSGTGFGIGPHRPRLYEGGDGVAVLDLASIASGCSPFRRSLWQQSPYRIDMHGAWDVALWIGFARLGARFRPTRRAVFQYRQHDDSLFHQRKNAISWARVHTTAMLKALRRNQTGVAILVPRDKHPTPDREAAWKRVRAHYAVHHSSWQIIEGVCPSTVWIKGAAVEAALSRAHADIVIIADADVMVEPRALRDAVSAVMRGAPWAMPHKRVFKADQSATQSYLHMDPHENFISPNPAVCTRAPYDGVPGGGIVVLKEVNFRAIGGIPYGFVGWGEQDRALSILCDTLLGPCHRGAADLLHLWHADQPSKKHPEANTRLLSRLAQAALGGKDAVVAAAMTMVGSPLSRINNPGGSSISLAELQAERDRKNAQRRRTLP
jgi:hypothetical protein